MLAAIYKEIDGYRVVKRFTARRVDTYATLRAAQDATADADTVKAFRDAARAVCEAETAYRMGAKAVRRHGADVDLDALDRARRAAHMARNAARLPAGDLQRAEMAAKPIYRELRTHEADPGEGCTPEALAALVDGEALTVDGEVIPDLRGTRWALEETTEDDPPATVWRFGKIKKLGVNLPAGAVRIDAMTEEQREAAGLPSLTPEE
jgi:hypothetical protein